MLKNLIRLKELMPVKKWVQFKNAMRLTGPIREGAIFLMVIGVLASAILIVALVARHSSQPPAHIAVVEPKPVSADEPVVVSAVKPAGQKSGTATITGCLERNDETFRLKDTTGADSPKSRSWKSGFLKKGPAAIKVVDQANRLNLPNHVGQRVTVTGSLVDREMQVRSLQRVAASCDKNPAA